MRYLVLLGAIYATLFAEFEVSGNMGLNSQVYTINKPYQHNENFTAIQRLELKYTHDALTLYSNIYAQEDSYDLSSDEAQHNDRTFMRLDELYLRYDFDNDMLSVGRDIKFWGSLEVRNVVDGFNPRDFRTDLFNGSKMGVYNITYSHYTETGEMSVILKLANENQPMASLPYSYYFFPSFISYDGKVKTTTEHYRPSLFLKYSGSTDTEYPLDYAFIYENGYDSQRYFNTNTPENLDPKRTTFGNPTKFNQYAYIANKFMTYETLVVGATLIKLEALYAKVDDNAYVGDYSHLGLGVEHTLENFLQGDAGLGLIAEYYRYDTYEDNKYNDLELFETMQDDLFLGLRYSLNNANNTNIISGVIADMEYNEQVYYVKFATRAYGSLVIDANYYLIEPSKNTKTMYHLLGKHQRVGLNVAWYF